MNISEAQQESGRGAAQPTGAGASARRSQGQRRRAAPLLHPLFQKNGNSQRERENGIVRVGAKFEAARRLEGGRWFQTLQ